MMNLVVDIIMYRKFVILILVKIVQLVDWLDSRKLYTKRKNCDNSPVSMATVHPDGVAQKTVQRKPALKK